MVSAPTYKTYIRAVVRAIRENGDMHTLWVEGMKEAATGGLPQIAPDGPWINDPLDRIVYSQHFYPGGTGTALRGADDAGPTSGSAFLAALRGFGDWCTTFGVRCSVGEVGWPSDESLDVAPGDPQSWNAVGARFYTRRQLRDGRDVLRIDAQSVLWLVDGLLRRRRGDRRRPLAEHSDRAAPVAVTSILRHAFADCAPQPGATDGERMLTRFIGTADDPRIG